MVWNTYRVSVPVPYVFSPCPSRFDHTPWFSGRCRSVLPKRWGSPTRQSYGIVIYIYIYMCVGVCVCVWPMCFIWKCFVENIIELPASSCVYVYNPPYYRKHISSSVLVSLQHWHQARSSTGEIFQCKLPMSFNLRWPYPGNHGGNNIDDLK